MKIDYTVEIIDNPCVGGLTDLDNMVLEVPVIIGQTEEINLDAYFLLYNGNCSFSITLAEQDCADVDNAPNPSTAPVLNNPMISFT